MADPSAPEPPGQHPPAGGPGRHGRCPLPLLAQDPSGYQNQTLRWVVIHSSNLDHQLPFLSTYELFSKKISKVRSCFLRHPCIAWVDTLQSVQVVTMNENEKLRLGYRYGNYLTGKGIKKSLVEPIPHIDPFKSDKPNKPNRHT